MYSQWLTQTQFKHKKFYHKTLIRFFLENALCLKNFQTILAITFWQKYTNFPSTNIKVACDMFQLLCGHKNLTNIEVRGRGTGKLGVCFTLATIYGQDCRTDAKGTNIFAGGK